MTSFFRVLDVAVDDKASALRAAVRAGAAQFEVAPALPDASSPFAYWVGLHIYSPSGASTS